LYQEPRRDLQRLFFQFLEKIYIINEYLQDWNECHCRKIADLSKARRNRTEVESFKYFEYMTSFLFQLPIEM
jgi:hypothetical protein